MSLGYVIANYLLAISFSYSLVPHVSTGQLHSRQNSILHNILAEVYKVEKSSKEVLTRSLVFSLIFPFLSDLFQISCLMIESHCMSSYLLKLAVRKNTAFFEQLNASVL